MYFGNSVQSFWDLKLAGALDEVSVYNRALSSNEIAAIYAAGAAGKCKPVNITSQPQSQTVSVGSNVTFSVSDSGSPPLSYQWRRDGADLTDGGNISGAMLATLSLTNVQSSDAGSYQVVITNTIGAVTSAVATLTVNVPTPAQVANLPASAVGATVATLNGQVT